MFRKLTNLSLSLLSLQFATAAEPAGEYLHRGAQKYIFGQQEKAKVDVTAGLEVYPQDEPLQQMLALFRDEEKKQDDQKDQQKEDKQDDQKKEQDQQKKDQQQKGEEEKKDQPKDGKEDKKDGKEEKNEGKPEQKEGQQGEPKENKDGSKPEPMPGQEDKKLSGEVKANASPEQQKQEQEAAEALAEEAAAARGEMTERQARELLESQKGEDEKVRLLDPSERKRSGRVIRDW